MYHSFHTDNWRHKGDRLGKSDAEIPAALQADTRSGWRANQIHSCCAKPIWQYCNYGSSPVGRQIWYRKCGEDDFCRLNWLSMDYHHNVIMNAEYSWPCFTSWETLSFNLQKINATDTLTKSMRRYMKLEEGSERIRQEYPVLDVPSHHVVLKTKETLKKICAFLQIECTAEFLNACTSIVKPQVSVTRNRLVWTEEQKRWLLKQMQKYSCLSGFTFEDAYDN